MKHLTPVLLLTLAIGLIGHAQTIKATGKLTGDVTVDVPDHPAIAKLQTDLKVVTDRLAKVEARLEKIAKKRVTVADFSTVLLEELP